MSRVEKLDILFDFCHIVPKYLPVSGIVNKFTTCSTLYNLALVEMRKELDGGNRCVIETGS